MAVQLRSAIKHVTQALSSAQKPVNAAQLPHSKCSARKISKLIRRPANAMGPRASSSPNALPSTKRELMAHAGASSPSMCVTTR